MRIQNPVWTDAYEAEEKAKAKYERALEKERAETDPQKKKALRKARLEKQHEYEALQKKRREIPKNKVVGDMTYTEWAKLRGLSSGKSLTSYNDRGKIPLEKYLPEKLDITGAVDSGVKSISQKLGYKNVTTQGKKIYFKEIKGEHTIINDAENTNPNYEKGEKWQYNCQRCVPAYEMRRRGFDVVAKPRKMHGKDDTAMGKCLYGCPMG